MYHFLTVHIHQSPSNISKLSEETTSSVTGAICSRTESYKFKTVYIPVCLDELDNVSISHPFRHHHKFMVVHHHSQQWQHVRMRKSFPGHGLLAKPLRGRHKRVNANSSTNWKAHSFDLHKVASHKYLQNLDCNLDSLMLTLPHSSERAFISWVFFRIVAERDLY